MKDREYQVCTNCVMDTSDSLIQFDEKGVCDHCNNFYNNILPNWHTDHIGAKQLDEIVEKIKRDGIGKRYDCIIGISGGVDSSYLLYYAKEKLGLRPLAFAVDTGWTLNVAVENIEKIVKGLGVDLYTEIVNWNEMKDLQLSFFKSQVPYQDTPQDHVIFASLYNYAVKQGIKYVLTGANYSTECVREPNEWVYVNDLRQIKDIHKKFGTKQLKTIPLCGMFKYRLYYRYFKGMKIVQPLNLIPYKKEDAISLLEERFGWQRYENKHFESVFTRFYEGYWLVKKFGYDKRRAHFSSLILTGQITREEALEKLAQSPYDEELAMQDLEYVAKKLGLTKEEFLEMMKGENKTFRDYKSTYLLIIAAIKFATLVGFEKRKFR
ncbi:MAG: N-acetyl sugar amidotransferase [Clostridiaceae bacterium]